MKFCPNLKCDRIYAVSLFNEYCSRCGTKLEYESFFNADILHIKIKKLEGEPK